MDTWNELNKLS